jgi:hypothetical protein
MARREARGFNRARRWVHRNVLGKQPSPTAGATEPCVKTTDRATGDKVDRHPGDRTAPGRTTDSDTKGKTNSDTERSPDMAGTNKQAPQPVGPVYQAARRVHATAAEYTVKGVMELRTEAYEFPWTIKEIANAVRARVAHCTKEAVQPEYAQALNQIATTVDAAAQAAARLGEAFDALHFTEVRRILAPRPGEDKWDIANNRP